MSLVPVKAKLEISVCTAVIMMSWTDCAVKNMGGRACVMACACVCVSVCVRRQYVIKCV